MNNVIEQEETICKMLDGNDPYARKAFDNLFIRFERDNHLQPTIHPTLLKAIYVERVDQERWKLTEKGHIGDSTCNRYRNMYIKHFYYFYEREKALAEAAADSEE